MSVLDTLARLHQANSGRTTRGYQSLGRGVDSLASGLDARRGRQMNDEINAARQAGTLTPEMIMNLANEYRQDPTAAIQGQGAFDTMATQQKMKAAGSELIQVYNQKGGIEQNDLMGLGQKHKLGPQEMLQLITLVKQSGALGKPNTTTLSPGQQIVDTDTNKALYTAPSAAKAEKSRIVKGADGFSYYEDTKERVFPEIKSISKKDKPDAMRKEFTASSKDFTKVRDSYARVVSSSQDPTAAGDLAMIFNYMKILDPGSVVRESEFATAAATGSFGERIKAGVDKVMSGQRLSDEMRDDFATRAKKLYEGMEKQHNKRVGTFKELARKAGLDPESVAIDLLPPDYKENLPIDTMGNSHSNTQIVDDLPEGFELQPDGTAINKKTGQIARPVK